MKKRFALDNIVSHISPIMTKYIKHIFMGISFFMSLSCIAVAQNPDNYTLESEIKIKSLQKTAQDTLQMYREIGATPQQIAIPYMSLSFLGHPSYPAIAPNTNICILIYKSPCDIQRKYIFMVRLQSDTNFRQIIQNLGWAVEDLQGWTFFTKSKSDFQLLDNKDQLIAYANQSIKTDIEFTTQPSILSLTRLTLDQDLTNALNNLNQAMLEIDLPEGQILINGSLNQKHHMPHLSSWLEKHGNCWGLNTKIINPTSNPKVRISLQRKDIGNFINQLRAKVLSTEPQ